MKKPVFPHCNTIYTISWILTVPILIDISTACTLFSFWIVWLLFFLVSILSIIRLWHGFAQKCYKFSFGLLAQLALGAAILGFFQLSFNDVIQTPLSHPKTPDIVEIANPMLEVDSLKTSPHDGKEDTDKTHKESEKKTYDDKAHIEVEKNLK